MLPKYLLAIAKNIETYVAPFIDKFSVSFAIMISIITLLDINDSLSNSDLDLIPIYDFHVFIFFFIVLLCCILSLELIIKTVFYKSYYIGIFAFCFFVFTQFFSEIIWAMY